MPTWKFMLRWGGGLALAAVLIVWVLHGIDPGTLVRQLSRASPLGLVAAGLINLGHNVFRVWRWRALLAPVRPAIPFRSLFAAVILGYAATWSLPGRVGEIVRPALLAGRERLPLGPCLGSVFADRLLDGACVVAMLGLGFLVSPIPESVPGLRGATLGLLLVIGLPALALLAALIARGRVLRWGQVHRGWLGWIARAAVSLASGLEALRRPRLLAQVALLTLGAWGMIAWGTWVGVRACGVDLPPSAVLLLVPLLVLGIALPTPGGAGGYHAAMKFGLVQLCLVAEPAAVGAGILMHAATVLPVIGTAALLLAVERVPLAEIRAAVGQFRGLGAAEAGGSENDR